MSDSLMRRVRETTIFVLSTAFILCGCAGGGEYGIRINKEEQETDYSTVYAETAEFSGFPDKEYESALNAEIQDDVRAAISQFDSLALESAAALPEGIKCDMRLTQDIKRNSGGIISFTESHYIYLGGAHGNTTLYPRTVNVLSDSPHNLSLGELFTTDDYLDELNGILDETVLSNPEKYGELWSQPELTVENENQFYMTDDELVIYFPPYTLSYYAKGFIEFPIPLADINALLNDEYRVKKGEKGEKG